ncbi:hypothetical protein HMPREF0063_11347 [Aeromicrobium marinum DSM 15272]|uniref:PrsW family intramembrane metalloprotease n=1 Tax=Aeromicrobium marinum DSM 15272 TaxID=585531 RepID=E2SBD8_9ACTN|nr:hypothetical protein HMPREF0063_11347 [Aeromicrobium marinum DSM 15272]
MMFTVVAVSGAVGVGVLSSQAGDARGAGLAVGLALIPVPLVWWLYWWLDRYEPEPRRYKFAAFVWGGVFAVAISIGLEVWAATAWDLSDDVVASFVAPVVEESAKGLFFLLTFLRARRVLDGFVDGLVYAGLVGLGFAFVENIGYYAISYLGSPDLLVDGADGATTTFVVRGLFSPLAHPLFTSAIGISFGLAVLCRSRWVRVLVVTAGWAGAVLMHGLWNASVTFGGGVGFVVVYLALSVLLAGLAVVTVIIRSRQVRVLERSLSYMAQRGWIHPAELPYLSRFGYRRQARRHARREAGREAARVVRRYQRLGTEMAFVHDAVMTGRPVPAGVERTRALLAAMDDLRPDLVLPPAIRPLAAHRS